MLKKGDVNTKYFHIIANNRKRKNYIQSLHDGNEYYTAQEDKQRLVFNHFLAQLGTNTPRSTRLNFAELGWTPQNLEHLDLPFTEEEVHQTIKSIHKEKAPGPDGFIGAFLSSCWATIKAD